MHHLGVVLAAILLLPVIATGAAVLLGWPIRDKLLNLSIGWVLGWLACYLAARMIVWVVAWWGGYDPESN